MATRRWILSLLPAAIVGVLAGCGGGSTANVQNPPPPPPQNSVAITFQTQPAAQIGVGFSEQVTAVVTNDQSNSGVSWLLTCQQDPNNVQGLCGSLSEPHTASGSPTTYTAPQSISTNSTVVEIVAFSTEVQNKNVVAPITVMTFNSQLSAGTYVLQAQGVDANNGLNYQIVAAIDLDGAGNVINKDGIRTDPAGEQTVNFADSSGNLGSRSDTIISTGSSYFLGSDGRGTITLNTGDLDIGGNGIETFTFVFLSPSQALIAQMDLFNTINTAASATGTLDLQLASPVAPSGGYAFGMSGLSVAKGLPLAFGGVINIDSPGTISGNGSVVDEILAKTVGASALGLSGTVTGPDQFGVVTLNLTVPFGVLNKPIPVQLMGYIVDDTHIKLIESDVVSGVGFGLTDGLAIGQGSATGTFKDNTAFSGSYVFGVLGTDLSHNPNTGVTNTVPATFTSAAVFTADGGGNLSNGYTDVFLELNAAQGTPQQPQAGSQISSAFTGTYLVDATGTGRATVTFPPGSFTGNPKHGYQPEWLFYLTGNGSPALVLQVANGAIGESNYPSLGVGIAYPQSIANLAFSGDYGFSITQQSSTSTVENDGTAPMNANPATVPPSVSGVADVDLSFGATPAQTFTGAFTAPAANGVFQGTLVDSNTSAVFNPQIAVEYFAIDSGHGYFVETDLVNPSPGTGQVSFGYYVARTPVCVGCP